MGVSPLTAAVFTLDRNFHRNIPNCDSTLTERNIVTCNSSLILISEEITADKNYLARKMPSEKRKARKQNYFKAAKQSRKVQEGKVLKEGMRGFLITCNNREREAVREAYNLFNEISDKLFGPEVFKGEDGEDEGKEDEEDEEDEEDIDAAFDKEKTELAEMRKKTVSGERRFQVVESGARNCIFIKTTLEEPHKLVSELIDRILETGVARARYILRLIPIVATCKAHEKNIEETLALVLPPFFPPGSTTSYSVIFKTRNNGSIGREEVIKMVGNAVRNLDGESSVDLKSPDLAIIVEVVRAVCCIGVAHSYFGKRKYNLVELVRPEQEPGAVKMETPDEIKTNAEGCEINSETSDGVKLELSDVKTENSDKVERDSVESTDGKGTPKINVNGNSEVDLAKGPKDVEAC